jgi:hypothetical protein
MNLWYVWCAWQQSFIICGCSCVEEDACSVKIIGGLYLLINICLFCWVYGSRLSHVEFYEVSWAPTLYGISMWLHYTPQIIGSSRQSLPSELTISVKVTWSSNPCCRMLLSMLQEPVICVMICESVRALQQCVSCYQVVVCVWCVSFAGGKSSSVTFEFLCSNTVYGIQLHCFTLLIERERV